MPDPEATLVWRSGFQEWGKVSELSELLPYFVKLPPLPPAPPALPPGLLAPPKPTQVIAGAGRSGATILGTLFSFRGRLNRAQYALIFLLGYLVPIVLGAVDKVID